MATLDTNDEEGAEPRVPGSSGAAGRRTGT